MKKVTLSLFVLAVAMVFAAGPANAQSLLNIFDQGFAGGLLNTGASAASQLDAGTSAAVSAFDGSAASTGGIANANILPATAAGSQGTSDNSVANISTATALTQANIGVSADAVSTDTNVTAASAAAVLTNNAAMANSTSGIAGLSFGWTDFQFVMP